MKIDVVAPPGSIAVGLRAVPATKASAKVSPRQTVNNCSV